MGEQGEMDELARGLVECYQQEHWLQQQLDAVAARARDIIEQIKAVPYVAGLDRGEPVTQRLRVPEYITRHFAPAPASEADTELLVRAVDCPGGCYVGGRHIHTADGEWHPVDVPN